MEKKCLFLWPKLLGVLPVVASCHSQFGSITLYIWFSSKLVGRERYDNVTVEDESQGWDHFSSLWETSSFSYWASGLDWELTQATKCSASGDLLSLVMLYYHQIASACCIPLSVVVERYLNVEGLGRCSIDVCIRKA